MPEIRPATSADLVAIARCHQSAFPKALSSAMGIQYLVKMLEWYLVSDRAFMFALMEGEECFGYCGGLLFDGSKRVGSASSMIQYSYHQAVKTLLKRPWLFFHPEFLSKYKLVLKNVLRRIGIVSEKRSATSQATKLEPHTGLIVIGVSQKHHGRGYGSALLQEFETQSTLRGYHKMMLTVRSDNQQAIRSYTRNGWLVTKVEGKSTTMEKKIHKRHD